MEINLPLVLLLIGSLLVIGCALKLMRRKKNTIQLRQPKLGDIDNLINEVSHHEIVVTTQRTKTSAAISQTVREDPAMTSLGFGKIDTLLTEPQQHFDVVNSYSHSNHQSSAGYKKSKSILSLYLMAPVGRQFIGYELLQALLAAGLRHGAMSIFHRYDELGGDGQVLFSLASATEPGIFDLSNMGGFSCAGLVLFMDINKIKNPEGAVDLMFETAKQLCDDLGGVLMDDKRKSLTADAILLYKKCVTHSPMPKANLAS